VHISKQIDDYLLGLLGAKPGEIEMMEDLKRFNFLCPRCGEVKSAGELVLLVRTPTAPLILERVGDVVEGTFRTEVGVCCKECEAKLRYRASS